MDHVSTVNSHNGLFDDDSPLAELVKITLGQQSLDALLERVSLLAKQAVPAADEASITLVKDDRAYTAAFTAGLARALDERQYENGYGPCLDAAVTGRTIRIDDMGSERTYPEFGRQALAVGVTHSLSVGLPVPAGTVGALNLWGSRGPAFDEEATRAAQGFAGYAAVALANAALYADTARFAEQMQRAMESRAVIEQAKGILMRDNRCSPDEAFAMLTQASNRSNRKLREIAHAIVDGTQRGT